MEDASFEARLLNMDSELPGAIIRFLSVGEGIILLLGLIVGGLAVLKPEGVLGSGCTSDRVRNCGDDGQEVGDAYGNLITLLDIIGLLRSSAAGYGDAPDGKLIGWRCNSR